MAGGETVPGGRNQSSSSEAQRQDGACHVLRNHCTIQEGWRRKRWGGRRGRGLEQERRKNREDAGHVKGNCGNISGRENDLSRGER